MESTLSKKSSFDDETLRSCSPSKPMPREVQGFEEEDEAAENAAPQGSQTDLERTMPPVKTDKEAIEEYESMRAQDRMNSRKWTKGKTSIYVDAFNLALDTVLDEEGNLFEEAEMSVFENWRGLPYEAQYLYALHYSYSLKCSPNP